MQTICDEEANNPSNYPSDAKYSFQLSFEVKKGRRFIQDLYEPDHALFL